ncbi:MULTISPECIES: hypothetical protein [unclassified Archaeoglobus]|jgi:hypothetical protein|uniref:hypothetical protein n=1 Tax=unclassified Archaeoglobus TaxID=2643606 RepID=UPI0025C2DD3C|nr:MULTISPECIES: hypothetical protein [unclassified Archaeoglobus]
MSAKRHIHTTIKHELYQKIVDLSQKRGERLNEVIEKAIERYFQNSAELKKLNEIDKLRIEVFEVMDVCIISKEQLRAIFENGPDSAIKNNANEIAVEWVASKPLDKLTLKEAIEAIEKIWLVCDRIRKLETIEHEDGSISLFFFSKMASSKIDEIWGKQLKYFFEKNFDVSVSLELRSQGFVLRLTK